MIDERHLGGPDEVRERERIKREAERDLKDRTAKARREINQRVQSASTAKGLEILRNQRLAKQAARSRLADDMETAKSQSADWEHMQGRKSVDEMRRIETRNRVQAIRRLPGRGGFAVPLEYDYTNAARFGPIQEYYRVYGRDIKLTAHQEIGVLRRLKAGAPSSLVGPIEGDLQRAIARLRQKSSGRARYMEGRGRHVVGKGMREFDVREFAQRVGVDKGALDILREAEQRGAEHIGLHISKSASKAIKQAALTPRGDAHDRAIAPSLAGTQLAPGGLHPRALTLAHMAKGVRGRGALRDMGGASAWQEKATTGHVAYILPIERLTPTRAAMLSGLDPRDTHGALKAKRELEEMHSVTVLTRAGKTTGIHVTPEMRHALGRTGRNVLVPHHALNVQIGEAHSTVYVTEHAARLLGSQATVRWSEELNKAIGYGRHLSDEEMLRVLHRGKGRPRYSILVHMRDTRKHLLADMPGELRRRATRGVYGVTKVGQRIAQSKNTLRQLVGEETYRHLEMHGEWSAPLGKRAGYGYGAGAVSRGTTASAAMAAGKFSPKDIEPDAPVQVREIGYVTDVNAMPRIEAAMPALLAGAVDIVAHGLQVAAHEVWTRHGISPPWQPLARLTRSRKFNEGSEIPTFQYFDTGALLGSLRLRDGKAEAGVSRQVGFFDDPHTMGHGEMQKESTAGHIAAINEFGGMFPSGFKKHAKAGAPGGGMVHIPARPWLSQTADLFGPKLMDEAAAYISAKLAKKGIPAVTSGTGTGTLYGSQMGSLAPIIANPNAIASTGGLGGPTVAVPPAGFFPQPASFYD